MSTVGGEVGHGLPEVDLHGVNSRGRAAAAASGERGEVMKRPKHVPQVRLGAFSATGRKPGVTLPRWAWSRAVKAFLGQGLHPAYPREEAERLGAALSVLLCGSLAKKLFYLGRLREAAELLSCGCPMVLVEGL
jgi:hypothetical protein